MSDERPQDPYSRVEYRRLIAWPARIEREAPFLRRTFAGAPAGPLLDLGCGTGEHARFLAAEGREVVGVDRSPSMLENARDEPLPPGLQFVEMDLTELGRLAVEPCGGAICLGNVLPHLKTDSDLRSFLEGLCGRLRPGGVFLLQMLNYGRIAAREERHLPLSFRPDDEGELVFLRLMDLQEDGGVLFFPTTLRFRPEGDPPLEVVRSKRVELRAWRFEELDAAFGRAGFEIAERLGNVLGEPFVEDESRDLIVVARKREGCGRRPGKPAGMT